MSTLPLYMACTFFGGILGYVCRKRKINIPYTSIFQRINIYITLFVTGLRIGSRKEIIDNIGTIGIIAFIYVLAVLLGSIMFSYIGRLMLGFDKYGLKNKNKIVKVIEEHKMATKQNPIDMMTINVIISAIIGVVCGYLVIYRFTNMGILFNGNIKNFDSIVSVFIDILLCTLLFVVGYDIGRDKDTMPNMKKAGVLIFLFPVFTLIGTYVASFLISVIICRNILSGFAICSGFSWYSLAPSMLINEGLIEEGAISFILNVSREVLSMVLIPLISRKVGYIECTSLAGAAAMDATIPITIQSTTPLIGIYSFISGTILTFSVPLLTTFFASLCK